MPFSDALSPPVNGESALLALPTAAHLSSPGETEPVAYKPYNPYEHNPYAPPPFPQPTTPPPHPRAISPPISPAAFLAKLRLSSPACPPSPPSPSPRRGPGMPFRLPSSPFASTPQKTGYGPDELENPFLSPARAKLLHATRRAYEWEGPGQKRKFEVIEEEEDEGEDLEGETDEEAASEAAAEAKAAGGFLPRWSAYQWRHPAIPEEDEGEGEHNGGKGKSDGDDHNYEGDYDSNGDDDYEYDGDDDNSCGSSEYYDTDSGDDAHPYRPLRSDSPGWESDKENAPDSFYRDVPMGTEYDDDSDLDGSASPVVAAEHGFMSRRPPQRSVGFKVRHGVLRQVPLGHSLGRSD